MDVVGHNEDSYLSPCGVIIMCSGSVVTQEMTVHWCGGFVPQLGWYDHKNHTNVAERKAYVPSLKELAVNALIALPVDKLRDHGACDSWSLEYSMLVDITAKAREEFLEKYRAMLPADILGWVRDKVGAWRLLWNTKLIYLEHKVYEDWKDEFKQACIAKENATKQQQ